MDTVSSALTSCRVMQLVHDDCQIHIEADAISFGAHMNIFFITKVRILELINGRIGPPNYVDF